MIRRLATAALLLGTASFVAAPAAAANKDMERLQLQVATLQSQLAEIQRATEESRREVRRLSELLAEQNALLQKTANDRRQQDEAAAAGMKDLSDRIGELAEGIQALKGSVIVPMAPSAAGGSPGATSPSRTPSSRRGSPIGGSRTRQRRRASRT